MIDEGSDWISFEDAVAYVEATQHCYREKAVELLRQAADNLKLKSKTVNSSPEWIVSVIAGQEILHSDGGKRIELWRKGLLELFPHRQNDATHLARPEIESTQRRGQPISDGIRLVIKEEWPGGIPKDLLAKDRDQKIIERLKEKHKKISANISRTIQRVIKADREAYL